MDTHAIRPARTVLLLTVALAAGWFSFFLFSRPGSAVAASVPVPGDSNPRQPVLVELFTSEGCSSCPPADALLARLDATQFVPGAQAIVLSEHVTYWNRLGWRDPYSSDEMTGRQQRYAAHFRLGSVYTPQIVVDGATEFVGNDSTALTRAVARAAATPKAALTLENVQWTGNAVSFAARSSAPHATLFAALAEDATQSSVARGENAGRTLRHVAVVRVLEEKGSNSADGRPLTLKLPARSVATPLRLVVFLTDRGSGRVLGVVEQAIPTQSLSAGTRSTAALAAVSIPGAH
jgi:hypothetical protein